MDYSIFIFEWKYSKFSNFLDICLIKDNIFKNEKNYNVCLFKKIIFKKD